MHEFGLYTKFTAREAQRDRLVSILLEAAESMKTVDGCELYVVNIADNDPEAVWVTEVWCDVAAHQDSLSLDTVQALILQAKSLLASVAQIRLRPVGGKGI